MDEVHARRTARNKAIASWGSPLAGGAAWFVLMMFYESMWGVGIGMVASAAGLCVGIQGFRKMRQDKQVRIHYVIGMLISALLLGWFLFLAIVLLLLELYPIKWK